MTAKEYLEKMSELVVAKSTLFTTRKKTTLLLPVSADML